MTLRQPPVYLHTMNDLPGVAAANNFISFFNPSTSGKVMQALGALYASYSGGTTTTANSLTTKRITAASGGTQVAASTIARFATFWPDPVMEVRHSNPTVTTTGLVLGATPPVISTGAGQSSNVQSPPPGASFLILPGEGLVFATAAGDVDQVWNITFFWQEQDI